MVVAKASGNGGAILARGGGGAISSVVVAKAHGRGGAILEREGCETVEFEKRMWGVVMKGKQILLGTHIDDFVIACANHPVLDAFQKRVLETFEDARPLLRQAHRRPRRRAGS